MKQRLQKILSAYGVASRRQAETMISDGRVQVNGVIAKLGDTADEEDTILIDGMVLREMPQKRYLLLNKPRGYETTLCAQSGRKTVADLVSDCGTRVYPVGRLDLYSEGLLLLTNDGALAERLMHPSHEIQKTYHIWVNQYHSLAIQEMKESIEIGGRMTKPAQVRLLHEDGTAAMLEITIFEGRNRQIRRLCEHSGLSLTRLKRIQEGPIRLGDLPVGKWRELTQKELELLLKE